MSVPNPSPVLDKNPAPMGPEILSSTGAGVWRKAPKGFPDSNSVLDKFQSASNCDDNFRFRGPWKLQLQSPTWVLPQFGRKGSRSSKDQSGLPLPPQSSVETLVGISASGKYFPTPPPYMRENGTICPFGVFFPNLQYCCFKIGHVLFKT